MKVDAPGVLADLPQDVKRQVSMELGLRWQQVRISPVLVSDEALGFLIRAADTPATFVEVFAPTHLMTRLAIARNQKTFVSVGVLASGYDEAPRGGR